MIQWDVKLFIGKWDRPHGRPMADSAPGGNSGVHFCASKMRKAQIFCCLNYNEVTGLFGSPSLSYRRNVHLSLVHAVGHGQVVNLTGLEPGSDMLLSIASGFFRGFLPDD